MSKKSGSRDMRTFLFYMAFANAVFHSNSQELSSDRVTLTSEKGAHTVVNFQCGVRQQATTESDTARQTQGRPGKKGPIGPMGQKGERGFKGEQGMKGEPGNDADLQRVRQEIGSMAVSNCGELKEYGITKTGYYLMRDPESLNAIYAYCDFQPKNGVSTCEQLKNKFHITESGFYTFLASNSTQTFQVYCNFSNFKAVTEIWHDLMREKNIKNCEGKGCYSTTPTYSISIKHIIQIIKNSVECKQYIKFRCRGAVIAHTNPASPFAWWTSRGGEKMLYWGGSTSRQNGYCACGETGTCVNNQYKCNCDNNGNVMTQDEGYLTDMEKLPVSKMSFGDAGDPSEYGWHTLGKLECM
ncbi:EGF and laminin G domain-containing protein-like [Styela clava]